MPDRQVPSVETGRRVLVTGGTGYIGRALVNRLVEAGWIVTVMVRTHNDPRLGWAEPRAQPRTADLLAPQTLRRLLDEGFDEVCHLAGLADVSASFGAPLDYFSTNVQGTVNLMAAMRDSPTQGRLVFLSSSSVYHPEATVPVTEQHGLAPASPYGLSKLAAEHAIAAQAQTGRLGAVVLRCFNVAGAAHGSRDHNTGRLVPRLVAMAAQGTGVLYADSGAVRDYVHVADVVDACIRALPAIRPGNVQTFNVGSGVGTRVADMVASLEQQAGVRVSIGPRPPEHFSGLVADNTAIRRHLAWLPTYSTTARIIADAWLSTL